MALDLLSFMGRMFFMQQIIINRIMADIVQMISQIGARIINWSTDDVLYITLPDHFHLTIIPENRVYKTLSESPVLINCR